MSSMALAEPRLVWEMPDGTVAVTQLDKDADEGQVIEELMAIPEFQNARMAGNIDSSRLPDDKGTNRKKWRFKSGQVVIDETVVLNEPPTLNEKLEAIFKGGPDFENMKERVLENKEP